MTDIMDNGNWLTLTEAAELLKLSERTLRRHIQDGKYKSKMEHGRRYAYISDRDKADDSDIVDTDKMDTPDIMTDNLDGNLGNGGHNNLTLSTLIAQFKTQLTDKDKLLAEQSRQIEEQQRRIDQLIEELTETRRASENASKRHDTIVLTLTQQLDQANLKLEDMRGGRSWWQRLFSRSASATSG